MTKEANTLIEVRDLDVIALAIQNTADEETRIDALAALRRVREMLEVDVEGQVPSAWYLVEKARVGVSEDVLSAARSVARRWRDVRRADDEIALLDVALSRFDAQEAGRG